MIIENSNLHQLDNGSILFRTDRNTEERFYKVFFMEVGKIIEFETTEVKNNDHEEAMRKCNNLKEVFEINKKFGIKNPIYTFQQFVVKVTHVN